MRSDAHIRMRRDAHIRIHANISRMYARIFAVGAFSRTRMASPSPDGYPDHRSQRNRMPQNIAVESLASKVLEVARQYAVHFEMKIMTESIMIENIKICHCDGEHCTITSCATRWQKKYCNHMNSMQGINWSTPLPDPEFAHHTSKTAAL